MITVLLVDDEATANRRMAEMLAAFPEIKVIAAVTSVTAALPIIHQQTPDVVFLDMEMPEKFGLKLLPHLSPQTEVVFVTGHPNYAIKAFEVCATDYLLKPVNEDRLRMTIDRFRSKSEPADTAPEVPAEALARMPDKLLISYSSSNEWVPFTEILWIEAEQNYTRVQISNRPHFLLKRSLSDWETQLPEQSFFRLGRSLILQIDRLRATEWQSRDRNLLFFDGAEEPLAIGRAAAAHLKELITLHGKK
jgi:two-component system LytT family response regulator